MKKNLIKKKKMAKRFTFADAKKKIKELEDEKKLFNDNIYTTEEVKRLKVYRTGFWILAVLNAALLFSVFYWA